MGSSFEELVAKNLAMKTNLNFDASFKSYDFLKILNTRNNYTWDKIFPILE